MMQLEHNMVGRLYFNIRMVGLSLVSIYSLWWYGRRRWWWNAGNATTPWSIQSSIFLTAAVVELGFPASDPSDADEQHVL
jgi:hypothetical protein